MTALQPPECGASARPKLVVYVHEGCLSCANAIEVAGRVRREFPQVDVSVVDLAVSSEQQPDRVFAVPTFMLDGELASLGTPSWERLLRLLEATLGIAAPDGGDSP